MEAGAGVLSRQSRNVNLSRSRGLFRRSVILVAHHEDVIRNRVALTMGAEGSLVLCASDGQEALEVARRRIGTIDLVITGATMPDLGTSDLCSQLFRERPGIKILVLSGTDRPDFDDSEDGLPYSPYPFDGHLLISSVRTILAAPPVSQPWVYMVFFDEPALKAARTRRSTGFTGALSFA